MAFRPAYRWPRGSPNKPGPCVFCQSRQLSQVRRAPVQNVSVLNCTRQTPNNFPLRRNYASQAQRSPQKLRVDIDKRNRTGFFILAKKDNIIRVDDNTAEKIITEFFALKKSKDPSVAIRGIAKKYKIDIEDLAILGLVVSRIPDVHDPRHQLPPSQHKATAGQLLVACIESKDPFTIIQIMNAVYLDSVCSLKAARDIVKLFSQADTIRCKQILGEMASQGNPDAMTLQGQILEHAGKREEARALYEKALEKVGNWDLTARFTIALPRTAPWNALGTLLLKEKDPESQARAKTAFKKGAQEDDPLAYYHLASIQGKVNADWLKGMSKAAASGHTEAMYNLANFYMNINSDRSSLKNDGALAKALEWLTRWKQDAPEKLGREWFTVAAAAGHKPSMLEMAELYESDGLGDEANDYLRRMTEPPPPGQTEQWPDLVAQAQKRLAGLTVRTKLG